MLYPQNGDLIVTIDSLTSLNSPYVFVMFHVILLTNKQTDKQTVVKREPPPEVAEVTTTTAATTTTVSFYPRDAMLARVLAMALCPSVCVCVCHKSVFYRNS